LTFFSSTNLKSWFTGMIVGMLGGLIGLGGAEFRLPILIGLFGFAPLPAVILNKAMSLVVVASALPMRLSAVPLADVAAQWPVVVNLLAGTLAGAWFGATWAIGLKTTTFYRVIAILLVAMAVALLFGHGLGSIGRPLLEGAPLIVVGIVAGFGIGVVASLLGVAGGELLIPTLVLLYGLDVKLAGSLSLAISLPTMIVGFARYSRDDSFIVVKQQTAFVAYMAVGSVVGTYLGAQLLRIVDSRLLLPLLAAILVVSAYKVSRHATKTD
jgi:uncharacterized membrane protein YfcA